MADWSQRGGGAMNSAGFSSANSNPPQVATTSEMGDFMKFAGEMAPQQPSTRSYPNGLDGQHLQNISLAESVRGLVNLIPTMVVYRTLYGNDRFFTSVCAPISLVQGLVFRGTVREYAPGQPQRVSERGPTRSGTWTESSFEMTLEYYGIGMRMTYQIMQTADGPEMFNMARNRMVDSFLDYFNTAVLRAYLTCNDAARAEEIAVMQDSWNDATVQRMWDRERQFFDGARADFAMQKLNDVVNMHQRKYGGTGDVWIMHPLVKMYISKVPAYNTNYSVGGPGAVATVNTPSEQVLSSLGGIPVYTVPDRAAFNSDMLQLLENRTVYGQYYVMRPRWERCTGSALVDCDLWSTQVYDADADQRDTIGLSMAIDACALWDDETGEICDINSMHADPDFVGHERVTTFHYLDSISGQQHPISYWGQIEPEFFSVDTLLRFGQLIGAKLVNVVGVSPQEAKQHLNLLATVVKQIQRIEITEDVGKFVQWLANGQESTDDHAGRGFVPAPGVTQFAGNEFGGLNIVRTTGSDAFKSKAALWVYPPLHGSYAGLASYVVNANRYDAAGFPNVARNAEALSLALETFRQVATQLDSYLPGNFLTSERYASSWWRNATPAHTLFENTLGNNGAPVFLKTISTGSDAFRLDANEMYAELIGDGKSAADQVMAKITGQLVRTNPDALVSADIGSATASTVHDNVVFGAGALPALATAAFVEAPATNTRFHTGLSVPATPDSAQDKLRREYNRVVGLLFNYSYVLPTDLGTGEQRAARITNKLNSEYNRAIVLSFVANLALVNDAAAAAQNADRLKRLLDVLVSLDAASSVSAGQRTLLQATTSFVLDNSAPLAALPSLDEIRRIMGSQQVQMRGSAEATSLAQYLFGTRSNALRDALMQLDAHHNAVAQRVQALTDDQYNAARIIASGSAVRLPLTYVPEQLASWKFSDTSVLVPADPENPEMPLSVVRLAELRERVGRAQSGARATESLLSISNTVRCNIELRGAETEHSELAATVVAAVQRYSAQSMPTSAFSTSSYIDPSVSGVLGSRGFNERWVKLTTHNAGPLERIAAMAYMATPANRRTSLALASNGIGLPLQFLLMQPRIRFRSVDVLKVKTGAETARSAMAYPISYFGNESQTLEFSAGAKVWHGCVVLQPGNVYVVRNFMLIGYEGGFGLRPFTIDTFQHDTALMDATGNSLFVIPEPIDGAHYGDRISIYGKHADVLPGFASQPGRNNALHYHNACWANQRWAFKSCRGPMASEASSRINNGEPFAFCWRGPHRPINVLTGEFNQIVTSAGYLATENQTHGMRKAWEANGLSAYPVESIHGLTQVR